MTTIDTNVETLQPAWTGLGTSCHGARNSEEAMRMGGMNFTVEKQGLRTVEGHPVGDYMATVRTDNNRILGIVGRRYEIIQNQEAFDFLDGLLQDGVMQYESCGCYNYGSQIWALARMPTQDVIAEGDVCNRYVLFSNGHDGTHPIHAVPTSTRFYCGNSLRMATSGMAGIRHTQSAREKLEWAKRYLSQFDEKFTLFRDSARVLATKHCSLADAKAYLEELFPTPADTASKMAQTLYSRKIDAVNKALASDRQNIPSIKDTWWALLNGVTESIEHAQRKTQPSTEEKRRAYAERRMINLMEGDSADFKQRAFELAVLMSA